MRRAAGDTTGRTVAAQIRQAARHLGYEPDDWRPKELWYGRCASVAALDDIRQRFTALQARETAARSSHDEHSRPVLAQRVETIRQGLADLARQVDELAADIAVRDG